MRPEASLNYPSYLPPTVDLLLLLLVVFLYLFRSGWISKTSSWLEAKLESTNHKLGTLFIVSCLVHLITLAFPGAPQPWVSDEQAYLLGAETFASGRLTNPLPLINPQLDQHFGQDHVLSAPTRQSKYPPGQSLLLAFGILLGHPAIALTLAAGAMTVSIAWCLSVALSRSMATFGALLSLFWVGVGSYWNHSYWGGSLAAIGGALVLGSFLRIHPASHGTTSTAHSQAPVHPVRPVHGLSLGLGVTLLLLTRPFEGFVYCMPFAVALLIGLVRGRCLTRMERNRQLTILAMASITTLLGLLFLGFYNQAVTGHALVLPHLLYTDQGPLGRDLFLWTSAANWTWLADIPGLLAQRLGTTLWFLLGTPLALAFLAVIPLGMLTEHKGRVPFALSRVNALAVLTLLVAQSFVLFWFPHYPAPLFAGLLLLGLAGLEKLGSVHLFGRTWKAPLLVAATLCAIVGCVVRLPAHRVDANSEIAARQKIIEQLTTEGGQHLVLVDPAGQGNGFWVHNLADPLGQTVLWARSLGGETDHRLVTALNRQAWRLHFVRESYQLVPYDGFGNIDATAPAINP